MFRKMRRFKQELSHEECMQILEREKRGVLSVLGDGGYPYGVPLNHYLRTSDGHLYFHGARQGHKIDAIARCDKVSYCVYTAGEQDPVRQGLNVRSVVVFGRMRVVEDSELVREICSELCEKFFPGDVEYAAREFMTSGKAVQCLELVPEHISGKLVNES
ncbi:MAG: pyridoxamine 5'-phosphate oxidase family protein [Atopobiaceae bacterium]|jgi:nitroimidazol reductase NimA-like FMN-containing flavoprotein (pyridoxamine 5'-phosphate oxidase superfamily)